MFKYLIFFVVIGSSLCAMEESNPAPLLTVTECLAKWGDDIRTYCFFDYVVDGRAGKTLKLEDFHLGSLEGLNRDEWKEVTTLFLGHNQLREISPTIVKHFTKLRDLYIGANPITYLSPDVVRNLPELELLDISRINLTEANVKELFAACVRPHVKFIIPYVSFLDRVRACNDWETLRKLQVERIALLKSQLEAQLKELEKEEPSA